MFNHMENCAHKILESAAQRTLHAHGFSRSSSQALLVLTDLLSRYLTLLASTCAKYAQHSGRIQMCPWDALCALDELGVDLEELGEYGGSEGLEMRRFAMYAARRLEPHFSNEEADSGNTQPAHSSQDLTDQPPVSNVEGPSSLLTEPLSAPSSSDFFTRVPYSQSSLSSVPERHLPAPPPNPQPSTRRLPTPQTQPALISAYHYILTHPPPHANPMNPSRHRVAMGLLSLTQTTSRWDPADTLYSAVAPCAPRVAAIGPTYPVPLVNGKLLAGKEDSTTRKLPPPVPRPVSTIERITPVVNHQASRIPDLARQALPSTVYSRTTKLHHPGVLMRGDKKLTYGPGVNAPWNTNSGQTLGTNQGKDTPTPGGLANGRVIDAQVQPVLQDARLYATWDFEPKGFKEPLVLGRRTRQPSMIQASSSSGLTLNLGLQSSR